MVVTRKDVALAAGVSPAVVSYVINGGPRPVAPTTKARVLRAVDELGYTPDPVARSMRTRRTNVIGLVLPDITYSYFSVVTQRMSIEAQERGLSVTVATSNGSLAAERRHVGELTARRVDALILMSVDPTQDFGWAAELPIPILVVDRPAAAAASAAAALQHLLNHGCRRIAHLTGPADALIVQRHTPGWNRALETLDDRVSRTFLFTPGTLEGGYGAGEELFAQSVMPDGVVIGTAPQALGFLRAAADFGVSIPRDMLVIAHDVGGAGQFSTPRLSSVDSIVEDVAHRALRALDEAGSAHGVRFLDEDDGFFLRLRESCGHEPGEVVSHLLT